MIPALAAFLLVITIVWLIAEFRGSRPVRIAVSLLAVLGCLGMAATFAKFGEWNYNASYGGATKQLIDASLIQLEEGHLDRVTQTLRGLSVLYQPTWDSRGNYPQLVTEATARMRGEVPIAADPRWDVPALDPSIWEGHWENDTGYWLVIDYTGYKMDVLRSGDPPTAMHSVSLSPDCKVLTFKESEQWLHTMTLTNRYEASHEWRDLKQQTVWQTDIMHKLTRATPEQRKWAQPVVGAEKKNAPGF